ncbi:heparan-alpha-glucosaminide N-acetyltransferase-like isoform X1 [Populus alba x Populus x berolinensis]|uniref:Heparan-alpha-glucosaminide N-acetyltransferase-like isoform X1 n=1 Tax=Populus alba x Populus x berolinensis TaxID=444605 RepID=A0AAD6LTI3_9ROSI|nr:heparan-alpha-glucosaminide N-acetyltransferase-like isoform X1 [Populus alba x Populus x berolinensis]
MIAVTTTELDERQGEPLLHNPRSLSNEEEEDITNTPSTSASNASPPPTQRLLSLDVFRGLTVALMILVDDAGGAFPCINHSPWFGVTLADFVMPFFLFVVGVSISLVFKKVSSKPMATKKVILRTFKLFLLGLLLQGGYFHGRHDLTYGVDVGKIRWMGVLQRISIGYLFAAMSEIWLVDRITVDSPMAFVKKYYIQWMVAFLFCTFYMCLLYGLYVPDWEFEVPSTNLFGYEFGTKIGFNSPHNHLAERILTLIVSQHCSVNSPDYGPLPPNSPGWCLAPFDPEGILSSLMAAITCFLGLQFGHILVHFKGHMQRLCLWSVCSFIILITGYVFELLGVPLCKPLYTLSYMCITAGASGLALTIIFYIVSLSFEYYLINIKINNE